MPPSRPPRKSCYLQFEWPFHWINLNWCHFMHPLNKIHFKRSTVLLATAIFGGLCTLMYELKQTINHINNIVDKRVLNLEKRNPQYIYIDDPKVKEELVNEIWDQSGYKPRDEWASFLRRWWVQRKRLVVWRLLELAQSKDKSDRNRAIETLASYTTLKDYEFRHIAQASDARTAVALARTKNIDMRFFLEPPYKSTSLNKQALIKGMRDLLVELNKKQRHMCVKYFLTKAFPSFQTITFAVDLELSGLEGPRRLNASDDNILQSCIESLVHHCTLNDNAKVMVEIGALPLLMDVLKNLEGNLESTLLLGRLIMKISLYPELLKDLFVTGWIGVIAQWVKNKDQRLSVPAASTLANLDQDDQMYARYGPDVFLLHPLYRTHETIKVDVVLIHGLLGGIHYTWKQRTCNEPVTLFGITTSGDSLEMLCSKVELISDDPMDKFTHSKDEEESLGSDYQFIMTDLPVSGTFDNSQVKFSLCGDDCGVRKHALFTGFSYCWPRDWLPEDCKNLRIIGINYDSRLSDWLSWCPLRDTRRENALAAKADDLLEQLLQGGVGRRPIVWITHSMGGLLLKQMLIKAHESSDPRLKKFCNNTKSIVFMSTPHMGSPLASLNEASRLLLLPSAEVDELRVNSPSLKSLHTDFLKLLNVYPIQIVTFVETENVKITALELEVECVPPTFGNSGVGELYAIPLCHMDICKPANRLSFIYQRILALVRAVAHSTDE